MRRLPKGINKKLASMVITLPDPPEDEGQEDDHRPIGESI
jgi:hypothetical protein